MLKFIPFEKVPNNNSGVDSYLSTQEIAKAYRLHITIYAFMEARLHENIPILFMIITVKLTICCPNHHHIWVWVYWFLMFRIIQRCHFQWIFLCYFIKQLDEFRLEIQRRDQEILAMAAKMKTLEEQHQVSVSFVRFVGKIVLIDSLCQNTYFRRITSATFPFWKNRYAPKRNTTICCKPTSRSCAHDWRRRIAWLKRKRRRLFRPFRNAIEWAMNWLSSKTTWISKIERLMCCNER